MLINLFVTIVETNSPNRWTVENFVLEKSKTLQKKSLQI